MRRTTPFESFKVCVPGLYKVLALLLLIVCLNTLPSTSVYAVPGFARQTGMACAACHSSFPALTAFGRMFKENGYTLTAIKTIKSNDAKEHEKMNLLSIAPLSVMLQSSLTSLNKAIPETQNNNVEFPQQLSLFYAGAVSSHLGMFLQVTYDPQSGSFGMDNADIRYANHATIGDHDLTYGFTLNNNPTVQDLWNTTPAWGYPYAASDVAPSPVAATLIDGGLGQQVAGLGAYAFFNQWVYAEITVYRSAPQGGAYPPDASSEMIVSGVAPYWRLAISHSWGGQYLEAGTFGLSSNMYPSGVSGLTDKYTDAGFDLQYENNLGKKNLTLHSSFVHEKGILDASLESGLVNEKDMHINNFKIDGNLNFADGYGVTLGYFNVGGSRSTGLYPPDEVWGSVSGNPGSNGILAQVYFLPWYNVKLSLQYTAYNRFNGGTSNYDGAGRNPVDNNNLYLLTWINF